MGVATWPTARDSKPMPMMPSNFPICLIGFWVCVEGFCAWVGVWWRSRRAEGHKWLAPLKT